METNKINLSNEAKQYANELYNKVDLCTSEINREVIQVICMNDNMEEGIYNFFCKVDDAKDIIKFMEKHSKIVEPDVSFFTRGEETQTTSTYKCFYIDCTCNFECKKAQNFVKLLNEVKKLTNLKNVTIVGTYCVTYQL